MHIAILGRQPAIGIAELEQIYGSSSVRWFSDVSALVDAPDFDFDALGGSQKAGRVVAELTGDWRRVSMQIVKAYQEAWRTHEGKITLGISAYGFRVTSRDIQKTGLVLKSKLKSQGVSLRLIPNAETALNTATSHHNKLGLSDNHVELLVVRASNGNVIVAESVGAQNITAIAARDQARPKTDAFVGMLPPKLARMMVNMSGLTGVADVESRPVVLDPFCGTGVVLQEASLLGFDTIGTDISQKMVDYSRTNLDWLSEKHNLSNSIDISLGDAMTHKWSRPINAVVCETYLGQPFSAPPSPAKLEEVVGNCNHIIGSFFSNLASQLDAGTPLCVAVPAWRDSAGRFTHLPLLSQLEKLGYAQTNLKNVRPEQLIYYRENQVVARQLLLLKKS